MHLMRRPLSTVSSPTGGKEGSLFYRLVLRSNVTYVTFIVVGAFAFGGLWNKAGDYFWQANNRGRLYKDIDWSKWNSNWKS